MSDKAHFEPIYPRHAIERCAWSLNFTQSLPEKLYHGAVSAARELLASHGIASVPVQSFQFDAATGAVSIGALYGPQEFRTPDGSLVLSLIPDAVIWQSTQYTRWNAFRDQLNEIVLQVAKPFTDALTISAVKLEYWDRFIWSGTWEDMQLSELLEKVDYVAWGAVKPNKPWHSHCGWFELNKNGTKRLVNINLNAVDFRAGPNGLPKPSIGIYTMIQDFFVFLPDLHLNVDVAGVAAQSELAHKDLKELFTRLITREMQERVSLNSGEVLHAV